MPGQGMVIDLAELERFIDTLRAFDSEMADSANKITSHFGTLGDAWRDQEYQKFAATWDSAMHAIDNYVDRHNENPKPFIWTASANDILEKVKRARKTLVNVQSV